MSIVGFGRKFCMNICMGNYVEKIIKTKLCVMVCGEESFCNPSIKMEVIDEFM